MTTEPDGVDGLRRIVRSGLADAAVLTAVRERDPRIDAVSELGFPTALLGHGDEPGPPWVDLDWEAAVRLAIRRTVAAGHRRVVFLASADHEIDARRGYAVHGLRGARNAARETGAEVRVHPSTGVEERFGDRLRAALTTRPAPTALVVQHLVSLPRLLAEVAALGLRVPEDLAVVLVGSLPDDPVASRSPSSNSPSAGCPGRWCGSPSSPSTPIPTPPGAAGGSSHRTWRPATRSPRRRTSLPAEGGPHRRTCPSRPTAHPHRPHRGEAVHASSPRAHPVTRHGRGRGHGRIDPRRLRRR